MIKHGIDQDALIGTLSAATAQQGEAVRKAVSEATLKALQGRELTLTHIKQVLNTVAQAASTGVAGNPLGVVELEALLGKAVAGMDGALEQAVQANRRALQQMLDQGASLQEQQLKKALADTEKMEDALFASLRKAAESAGAPLEGPWNAVQKSMQSQGSATGTQASAAVEQLMESARQNLRDGRALGLRASQAMLDSYATLVSGVLIGMSEALQRGSGKAAAQPKPEPARPRKK
ncbi:hypothetical protein J2X19_003723 [Rhodoferax ferrireducens]|uniref:Phasin domain-containing protein n=1 Tax=Rhodoferax ferrireducens TaxID=192843 RepID=A0ABU2CCG6_9BURK|nr:DUF6781 family protein [Rhodoferax ferrireducens]MDR7379029.1 hypothetical protein [Rhodoferax ferrireducens]